MSTEAAPFPAGATEVSEWCDVGHPDEFRTFTGPTWTVANLAWNGGDTDPTIIVFGTQLADGTVEGRCIRVDGLHWDYELSADNARTIGTALIEAADALDRLGQR